MTPTESTADACQECGRNLDALKERFVVVPAVWAEAECDPGAYCVACLERKLPEDRRLFKHDFDYDAPENNTPVEARSDQLRSRMDSTRTDGGPASKPAPWPTD